MPTLTATRVPRHCTDHLHQHLQLHRRRLQPQSKTPTTNHSSAPGIGAGVLGDLKPSSHRGINLHHDVSTCRRTPSPRLEIHGPVVVESDRGEPGGYTRGTPKTGSSQPGPAHPIPPLQHHSICRTILLPACSCLSVASVIAHSSRLKLDIMPRDRDMDNASLNCQSKRPPLHNRNSDSQSDTTTTSGAPAHHHRAKTHQKHHHHVGRLTARVPSTKAFHKHPNAHAQPPKLIRRQTPGPASPTNVQRPTHRRATSEVKLPRQSSPAHLPKSLSHTSLKRNRSHVEIGKPSRSSDKLKRSSSGTGIHRHTPKTSKTQVHFDLGCDDLEDEWVDASGSNSPYLSRKSSLNSSAHSSLRPSTEHTRPTTPAAPSQTQKSQQQQQQQQQEQPQNQKQQQHQQTKQQDSASPPGKDTSQLKEYLTSRLLQRTPSQSAPPQMTVDMAQGAPAQLSRSISSTDPTVARSTGSNNRDELVSRFVDTPRSGLTSQGSLYQHPAHSTSQRSDDGSRRLNSMDNLDRSPLKKAESETLAPSELDTSALIPKSSRRSAAPPAETSRTQQKLNLQRASSVLEPGQGMSGAGGVVGSSPLIGVGGPGYDGGNSRDPRIGKLLERTGMEYLVVRRYQNPVARSLNRLSRLPGMEKSRRISQTLTGTVSSKRGPNLDGNARHSRNASLPDARQSASGIGGTIRTNGAGSSLEEDDVSRINKRLSGVSLVGAEEEDGINALLRNLWERSMDLSASTD